MQNISTKELNYVKDLISWELLSKKNAFSMQIRRQARPRLQTPLMYSMSIKPNFLSSSRLGCAKQLRAK